MPGDSVLSGRDGSQKKLIITSAYIIGGLALIAMCFNLGIFTNFYLFYLKFFLIITLRFSSQTSFT